MGEFRIGRTRAQHSYPESRQNTTVPYARNSALFVKTSMVLTGTPAPIPWSLIESTFAGGVNVPITPKTTGLVLLTGMVTIVNTDSGHVARVLLNIKVGAFVLAAPFSIADLPANPSPGSTITIPIVFSGPTPLLIGSTTNIQIQASQTGADADTVSVVDATLSLQEVVPATG